MARPAASFPTRSAPIKTSTYNPQAQLMIKDGVDGRVGDLMETLQRLVGIVGYTGGITQQEQDER